jgi:hypothetical protein
MLPGEGFFIQISPDDLGHIINVMPWGIRVSFKSMKLLVLGHLSNKAFKEIFFAAFFFRLGTLLLLKLFFLLLFEEFLFFLPFLLDIFLHVHDFVLN